MNIVAGCSRQASNLKKRNRVFRMNSQDTQQNYSSNASSTDNKILKSTEKIDRVASKFSRRTSYLILKLGILF